MSMLQELLNLGLVEIGSDDSRFEKMQAAASALAKRFGEEPHLLIPATLVALDEDVDEDDPFFILVEEIVTLEWKTLRNTHANRPRQLLRSIAIDALATAATESAEVSSVIWNTAASLMRHQQMRLGKAAGLIEQLLSQAYERAETEAIKRAGMSLPPSKRKSKKPSYVPAELKLNTQIKADELITDVARAAGPQHPAGQPLTDPNPHWPNAANPWSHEFNPRMTAALVKAVNLGTSRLAKSVTEGFVAHVTSLDKHLFDQINAVEEVLAEVAQSNASGHMRLNVLWWSEACYSPLLKKGYRELIPSVGALIAAIDLATIIPPLAPASVTYVLAEMVADICSGAEAQQSSQPLEDYIKVLATASLDLRSALPQATTSGGRVPLVELVSEATAGAALSKDIVQARAGIKPDLQMTPSDFAMWMFREIQASRLVEGLS
jgi:hypothetical protein